MAVRFSRPRAAQLLGSETKVLILAAIQESGGASLTAVARATSLPKSTVTSALRRLAAAGVIEREGDIYRAVPRQAATIAAILALDEPATGRGAPSSSTLEAHRGRWVAVDEAFRVLASADNGDAIRAEIHRRDLSPWAVLRVPDVGQRIEGALVA